MPISIRPMRIKEMMRAMLRRVLCFFRMGTSSTDDGVAGDLVIPEYEPDVPEIEAISVQPEAMEQYSMEPEELQRSAPLPAFISKNEDYLFTNREISWLAFNRRVLREAENHDNPLLERVKFLSITASNLDEFFMVRFASLRDKMLRGVMETDPAGYTPRELVDLVAEDARAFMTEQIEIYETEIKPSLAQEGIRIWQLSEMDGDQVYWLEQRFHEDVMPCVMPYVHTGGTPFPQVAGRALQFGMLLRDDKKEEPLFASAQAPAGMRRMWAFPQELGGGYALLEDLMILFAAQLLPGRQLLECWPYRVTRDEDYTVPENSDTRELIAETRKSLKKRKTGAVVRLEVDSGASPAFVAKVREVLSVGSEAVYRISGPLNLTFLSGELYKLEGRDALRYPPFSGQMPLMLAGHANVFEALREGDVFLHHPYDSFDAVLRFVREAAADARVLAINMTLYRVSGDSPVIKALCDAAEAGKRVTVLLELKARFDEENNIRWGEVLAKSGCEVIYGLPRLKTHSKITLVVRREASGVRRYVHLGTGNYNDVTAKLYTDMGLLTSDRRLGEDSQAFFNMVTGFSKEPNMRRLVYAPRTLRQSLTALIEAEIQAARAGAPCGIFAKMNSLVDPSIIRLLYDASASGVPVKLIVRGVCCLRAGVPGLSDNIEVRSIVGRFLEHSRVFRFENGGNPRIFLSSADWMPRNLNKRIELMFPVTDSQVKYSVQRVLDLQWRDNLKAWRMLPDGRYERMPREGELVNAQEMQIRRSMDTERSDAIEGIPL